MSAHFIKTPRGEQRISAAEHSRLSLFDQQTDWLADVFRKLGEIVVLLSVGSLIGLVIGLAVRWPK